MFPHLLVDVSCASFQMLSYIVYFPSDKQYIIVNDEMIEFKDPQYSRYTIEEWKTVEEAVSATCVYESEVHECVVAFVSTSIETADFILKRIRMTVSEKKSSFETIRKKFPFVSTGGRTKVVPLSQISTSSDESPVKNKRPYPLKESPALPPLPKKAVTKDVSKDEREESFFLSCDTPKEINHRECKAKEDKLKKKVAKLIEKSDSQEQHLKEMEKRISRLEKYITQGDFDTAYNHNQLSKLAELSILKEKIKDPDFRKSIVGHSCSIVNSVMSG